MTGYSDDELAALRLLRRSYSWSIGMDFRSRVWGASFAGDRIRRDTPPSSTLWLWRLRPGGRSTSRMCDEKTTGLRL